MQLARNHMVEVEDIVNYGHRISRTMCEMQFENQKYETMKLQLTLNRLVFLPPYPTLPQLQETRLFLSTTLFLQLTDSPR